VPKDPLPTGSRARATAVGSPAPAREAPPRDESGQGNRKLIRPRLQQPAGRAPSPGASLGADRRRPRQPEHTGAEAAFLGKHSQGEATVAVTLEDGVVLHGVVEWTDRDCLKLRRRDLPGIVVMKQAIVHVQVDERERVANGPAGNAASSPEDEGAARRG
jgi:host factor-I protein